MKKILSMLLLFFVFLPITNAINIEVSDETLDFTDLKPSFTYSYYNSGIDVDFGDEIELINSSESFKLEYLIDEESDIDLSSDNEIYNYFLDKLGKNKLDYLIGKNIIFPINNPANDPYSHKNLNSKDFDKLHINKTFNLNSNKEIKNYKIRIYLKPLNNNYWNVLTEGSGTAVKLSYFNNQALPQNFTTSSSIDNKREKISSGYLLQTVKYKNMTGTIGKITQLIPYIDYSIDIKEGANRFSISYDNYIYNDCYFSRNYNCGGLYYFSE